MNTYYETPLVTRYASEEMSRLFSYETRTLYWRRLWIALAEAERSVGLPITEEQIKELKANANQINWDAIEKYEHDFNHDVVAHIHAFGDLCPKAKPILHLGATSATITDNGDLLQMQKALHLIRSKLRKVIEQLSAFAKQYKDLPCLGFTHFQPAQPTTVGKRATLWIQDFLMDLEELDHRLETFRFLGLRGATGTQASFLQLVDGNEQKVCDLEEAFAKFGDLGPIFSVSGQTYPRKQDAHILDLLAGIATSAHKFATDLRLLAHLQEITEPFEEKQVGSSAMPQKQNPIRSERICSLARHIIAISQNPKYTAALQWFERTLDDSANRRITIPEAFLATDGICDLLINLKLIVNEKAIHEHLQNPQLIAEQILMDAVIKGGDRQALHEKLRRYAQEPNFLEKVAQDPDFDFKGDSPSTGCASSQVERFLGSL